MDNMYINPLTIILTLPELYVCVLRSFIKFNKAPTKNNEALTIVTKPYHVLIEILL